MQFEPKLNNKMRQHQADFDRAIWRYQNNPSEENVVAAFNAEDTCNKTLNELFGKCYWDYSKTVLNGSHNRLWFYIKQNTDWLKDS